MRPVSGKGRCGGVMGRRAVAPPGGGKKRGGPPLGSRRTQEGRAEGERAAGRPPWGCTRLEASGVAKGRVEASGGCPREKGGSRGAAVRQGVPERSRQGPMNAWAESGRATPRGTPLDSVSFTAETPGSTPRGREWHRGGETIRGTIGQARADSWRLGDLLGFAAGRGWGTVEGCLDSRTCPSCWRT